MDGAKQIVIKFLRQTGHSYANFRESAYFPGNSVG